MQPSQESLDILRKVSEKIETWHHLAQYIKDNNLKSYFINDCTCIWEPGTYERKKRH
jgi:hypothetical protein